MNIRSTCAYIHWFSCSHKILILSSPYRQVITRIKVTKSHQQYIDDMLRRTGLFCLTFDQLLLTSMTSLCSPSSSPPVAGPASESSFDSHDPHSALAVSHNGDAASSLVHNFRALSAHAPLPLPLARLWVATLLSQERYDEAAAVVHVHPLAEQLMRGVAADLTPPCDARGAGSDESVADTLAAVNRMDAWVEACLAVNVPGTAYLLQAMCDRLCRRRHSRATRSCRSRSGSQDSLTAEAPEETAWQRCVERVRGMILAHIRSNRPSITLLLPAFCQLSGASTGATVEEEVLEVLHVAMHGGAAVYVSPRDFAHALCVLVTRTRNYRRALSLWSWMQHTSACCDGEAVSWIIESCCALNKVTEAVQCVRELASHGVHPTVRAQVTLLRCLGESRPPLHEYAEKLVEHWYGGGSDCGSGSGKAAAQKEDEVPSSLSRVWCGEAQDVGIELIAMHFRLHHRKRVVELIQTACRVFAPCVADGRRGSDGDAESGDGREAGAEQRGGEARQDGSVQTCDGVSATRRAEDYIRFVTHETVGHVICYLEAVVARDPVAVRVLFDGVMTWTNGSVAANDPSVSASTAAPAQVMMRHPFLIGILVLLGHRLGRVADVMDVLQPCAAMTDEQFAVVVKCISTYGSNDITTEVQLDLITKTAKRLERDVPRDVAAWYKLLNMSTSQNDS